MRFLPVFLDLTEGVVSLVGAGPAALNKLRLLRAAGAQVRWYSKDVGFAEEVLTAALSGPLEISFADPRQADFADCIAVVSAAGDALDDDIAALARSRHVPVNVVDRPELSTFIFPAIVDRGDASRLPPAARRRCWRAGCVNASKHCCRRGSAISPP
jgi:uroporphyrin-III C-methyltransferase/precorrin-2 dehydrogenase/sirohydrochlorin ferrochelatase